jgi:hypothetical protein
MDFGEWRQEQDRLSKAAPTSSIAPISPLSGGTYLHPPGSPADIDRGPSRYSESDRSQPDPWIDDVESHDFYSPMQPLWPFGPPNITHPRAWDYPIGYNLNYVQARMEALRMFRSMARSWGVLSTIITTRQDQLMRIPWTIQRRDRPQVKSEGVKAAKEFMKRPDGQLRYTQWANKLLFDLLEIDAPSIYFFNDRMGRPLKAVVMDGTTFFPLIDDMGMRPTTEYRVSEDGMKYLCRQPAFQQIIKGMPLVDLDESELMYVPMRPRPDMPMFGFPATEQIIIETSEAIRKTFYQLNFWAEGTIPDLIVTVPDTWSPRQIAMFQAHSDAAYSGNTALKSKIRYMPGGMKPFDIKNSSGESLWSQRDETLIRLACYAYSVSPTPFIKQVNRSVAQNAQEAAEQEGLYPLMSFWKDNIIDPIIQDRLGLEDIEFIFLPRPERDSTKQATVLDMYVKRGIRNRNEARAELGDEPIPGGDTYTIELGNAIVPVEDAAHGLALPSALPGSKGAPSESSNSNLSPASRKPPGGQSPNSAPQRGNPRPNHEAPAVTKLLLSAAEVDDRAILADGDVERLSHRRIAAGNYRKGHIRIGGLDISIENSRHSVRGKRNPDESLRWSAQMPAHYGYVRGTVGADGDQVDVFIGRRPDLLDRIYVIDQMKITKKQNVKFDEHKIMLGYKSLKRAVKDYERAYNGRAIVGTVTEVSLDELKTWLRSGDLRSPISGWIGNTAYRADYGSILKGDTISLASGFLSQSKRKRKQHLRDLHFN